MLKNIFGYRNDPTRFSVVFSIKTVNKYFAKLKATP